MSRLLAVLAGLALTSALGACSDGEAAAPPALAYVALGDSYAAAPGVPETAGEDGCFRSSGNYAHLLAGGVLDDGDVALTDVTCSGATTSDVLEKQVPSLDADTDLVTIGIGGNDYDLFTRLIRQCLVPGEAAVEGTPCSDESFGRVASAIPRIDVNVGSVLDAVVEAAPNAQVVVVGYPDLLPDAGTCPDRLPLAPADYPFVDSVISDLSASLRTQAEQRDLAYVDVFAASQGHDICSDEPWINGAEIAPDGTIPFHPFAAEQAAVAELVRDVVEG